MDVFKKQLFIQLGVAFGVLVFLITAIQLMASELSKTALKIQSQKSELLLRSQATDSLAALKSDFEKAKPLFSLLNSVLPPKDQLINLGKDLGVLAQQNRIDLGFTFGGEAPPTEDVPGFIRFSMTGSATYANFTRFLKDIEKMRLYIKLVSLDMTRQAGSDSFNFVASGQVFYQ